ncbi:hypothetical protein NDU88_005653 [Pleurodeles waltl]|uniref:Uncharacterized protein n=1 Tax=Pleurodeles waltl TaxID=8319 RepID=A0AAV7PP75_PLEWA|nr:hypothetical protein NDU88_005653 [Pleurodeles waltl]
MGRGARRHDGLRSVTDPRRWDAQFVVSVPTGRSAPASEDATRPPGRTFPVEMRGGLARRCFQVSSTEFKSRCVGRASGGFMILFTVVARPPPPP